MSKNIEQNEPNGCPNVELNSVYSNKDGEETLGEKFCRERLEWERSETEKSSEQPRRPRRLRLPFDNRRQDAGGWAYDHRIGLSVTLALYFIVGIAFLTAQVVIHGKTKSQGMYIDISDISALEAERDRLLEEVRSRNSQIDWNSIKNISSNENALNENLADSKGNNAQAINSMASETEANMRANREAYEKGISEVRAIGANRSKNETSATEGDVKRNGRVTVSFSLDNPLRHSRKLVVPSYLCEGGGEVVVNIVVNQRGDVISAQVASGGDECMRECALRSARSSKFDANDKAPVRHTGTITYIFIPQ